LRCGDGVFTSILRGGSFKQGFDIFDEIDFTKEDIYDFADGNHQVNELFSEKPMSVDTGLDIKPNIVKKAEELGVYNRAIVGSATNLTVQGEKFKTVFSNVLKNVGDIETALSEITRVLAPEGKAVLVVSSHRYRDFLYYYNKANEAKKPEMKEKHLTMDRGRAYYNIHCYDIAKWTNLLESSGLSVESYVSYLTKKTMRFWDTGWRNFSYLTVKMMNSFKKAGLKKSVKNLLVSYLDKKMRYLTNFEIDNAGPETEGAYYIIVACKK